MLNSEIDYLERRVEAIYSELLQLQIIEQTGSDVHRLRRIKSLNKDKIFIENKLTDFWDSYHNKEDYN